jgi:hypothetical protein
MSSQGLFAPCLEFTDQAMPLNDLLENKKTWLARCADCNAKTPCFYNCFREIGLLWRKKWRVFMHFPAIIGQMVKYGNFF